MDVIDKNDMKGHYLIMDNVPIHKPATIRNLIENRGYKCTYLPPYSPFLNLIKLFWPKSQM
jgi:transposase